MQMLGAKFILAILPVILVFIGILLLKRSGSEMAIFGWLIAAFFAVVFFHTSIEVVIGASIFGILKALGITIAVVFTMLMIFLMKETGALNTISDGITGTFFAAPQGPCIAEAVRRHRVGTWSRPRIQEHARRFSAEAFRSALRDHVAEVLTAGSGR